MSRTRMAPEDRERQLMKSAMKIAKKRGYDRVTRVEIALDTGTSEGLINRYFGNKAALRNAIMKQAVRDGDNAIIAQGVENNDPIAKRAASRK